MLKKLNAFTGRIGAGLQDTSWLLLRVLGSAMFMTHGFDKLFGDTPQPFRGGGMTAINIGEVISWPVPFQINALFIAGTIEFFGGTLILLGLWTRLAAFFTMLLMVMAYLTAHLAWFPTLNRGELAAMYWLVFLAILSFGPGRFSLDRFLETRHREKMEAASGK